jgi:hypothetical protein
VREEPFQAAEGVGLVGLEAEGGHGLGLADRHVDWRMK